MSAAGAERRSAREVAIFLTSAARVRSPNPKSQAMSEIYFTHAKWHVKPGKRDEFVAAWQDLGKVFGKLTNQSGRGTLIQSLDDPDIFHSFGPWPSLESIKAARADPAAQAAIERLRALCVEATPGAHRLVLEIEP